MSRPAGFWIRFAAWILDGAILSIVATGAQYVLVGAVYAVWKWSAIEPVPPIRVAFDPAALQTAVATLYLVFSAVYSIVGHKVYGTTLAKRLFGIRVRSLQTGQFPDFRQSLLRYVGYAFSYLPMGIGFMMSAFHPQKRALHEILSGTCSVLE